MKKLHNLYFDSMKEFASSFIEDLDDVKQDEDIAYIGNFKEIIEITNELVKQGCSVYNISDLSEDIESLFILEMSTDKKIWICPISCSHDKKYIRLEDKYVYFSESSSKERDDILKASDSVEEWYNVVFDDDKDCRDCSEKYDCPYYDCFTEESYGLDESDLQELTIDVDDDLHGFSVSSSKDGSYWSKSFWTSEKLSENKINSMLDKFDKLFDFGW